MRSCRLVHRLPHNKTPRGLWSFLLAAFMYQQVQLWMWMHALLCDGLSAFPSAQSMLINGSDVCEERERRQRHGSECSPFCTINHNAQFICNTPFMSQLWNTKWVSAPEKWSRSVSESHAILSVACTKVSFFSSLAWITFAWSSVFWKSKNGTHVACRI